MKMGVCMRIAFETFSGTPKIQSFSYFDFAQDVRGTNKEGHAKIITA
jgi:hypothetical protein